MTPLAAQALDPADAVITAANEAPDCCCALAPQPQPGPDVALLGARRFRARCCRWPEHAAVRAICAEILAGLDPIPPRTAPMACAPASSCRCAERGSAHPAPLPHLRSARISGSRPRARARDAGRNRFGVACRARNARAIIAAPAASAAAARHLRDPARRHLGNDGAKARSPRIPSKPGSASSPAAAAALRGGPQRHDHHRRRLSARAAHAAGSRNARRRAAPRPRSRRRRTPHRRALRAAPGEDHVDCGDQTIAAGRRTPPPAGTRASSVARQQ